MLPILCPAKDLKLMSLRRKYNVISYFLKPSIAFKTIIILKTKALFHEVARSKRKFQCNLFGNHTLINFKPRSNLKHSKKELNITRVIFVAQPKNFLKFKIVDKSFSSFYSFFKIAQRIELYDRFFFCISALVLQKPFAVLNKVFYYFPKSMAF